MADKNIIKLRRIIEQAMESAGDRTVSEAVCLMPRLRSSGLEIPAGYRIQWNGKILKAAVCLWDSPAYFPDRQPTLWQEISYRKGFRIIPASMAVTDAFALHERGWWKDSLYESLTEHNVYPPDLVPANWKKVIPSDHSTAH